MGWRPVTKLRIANESPFYGPGCQQLLSLIRDTGSVRHASEQMGLSYSKAWRMIRELEAQAGFPVIVRRQGGRAGGAARLTEAGERLLRRYGAYAEACARAIEAIFLEHFSEEASR